MIDLLKEKSASEQSENRTLKVITEGQRIYEEHFNGKYKLLGEQLGSEDQKEQMIAANTMQVMLNQMNFMEKAKEVYGEATITTSLGSLAAKIVDVVRVG